MLNKKDFGKRTFAVIFTHCWPKTSLIIKYFFDSIFMNNFLTFDPQNISQTSN